MPRGQKLCANGHSNGPRAYVCAECNLPFTFKKESTNNKAKVTTKKKEKIKTLISVDWKTLNKGDHILVKGGPYHSTTRKNETIKQRMGYKGHYIVREIQPQGILAYSGKKEGYAFIYMGPEETSQDGIIHRRPHKLRLMRKIVKD